MQTNFSEILHGLGLRIKMYFTTGQISNHVELMGLLRSLGGEVLDECNENSAAEHPTNNEGSATATCSTHDFAWRHPGGWNWVQEHLGEGYVPTWTQPLAGPGLQFTGNRVDQSLKNLQDGKGQLQRRWVSMRCRFAISSRLAYPGKYFARIRTTTTSPR